jgi:hypothetical protein
VPRRNNRRDDDPGLVAELVRRGVERVVLSPDGAWLVRNITADGAVMERARHTSLLAVTAAHGAAAGARGGYRCVVSRLARRFV